MSLFSYVLRHKGVTLKNYVVHTIRINHVYYFDVKYFWNVESCRWLVKQLTINEGRLSGYDNIIYIALQRIIITYT